MTDGVAITPREVEFERVCLEMLARGIKPTPGNLEERGFGNGKTIRGNYVRIRTRLLKAHGYRKDTWSDKWVRVTQAGDVQLSQARGRVF